MSYIWNLKIQQYTAGPFVHGQNTYRTDTFENLGTESDKLHHKAYRNFRCLPRKKNRKAEPSLIDSPNNYDVVLHSNTAK